MPRRALLPTLRQSLGFGLALPELSGHRTEVPNICDLNVAKEEYNTNLRGSNSGVFDRLCDVTCARLIATKPLWGRSYGARA